MKQTVYFIEVCVHDILQDNCFTQTQCKRILNL